MKIGLCQHLPFTCRHFFKKHSSCCRIFGLVGYLFFQGLVATAQESPAAQPYAQRLFLNPAFTGLLSDYSVTAGHRSQWTGANTTFSTQWLSGEYRFIESKNAVGATFLADKGPAGGYSRVHAGAVYAYHTKLRRNLDVSAGLQAAYGSQRPGSSDLIFEDQIGGNGSILQPSAENLGQERSSYLTVATGLLLFTNQFWLGVAGYHLNSPTIGEASENTVAPVFQVHSGYRFYIKSYFTQNAFKEISFSPTLSYTQQRAFNRIDAVLYSVLTPVTVGFGYTLLPGEKKTSAASTITAIAGVTHKGFKVGYSYRHPLAGGLVSLGPAHEISISFEKVDYLKIFKRSGSDKNYNRIACPAF